MTINIYSIMLIMSVIAIFGLYIVGRKQENSIYLLLFCAVTLSFIGQYTVSTASSLETALVGHRIFYTGGVLTPTIMLLCVARLCKIKLPKPVSISFIIYSVVILYFVYNVGIQTYYYSSVSIDTSNNMTYLVKEYGPVHFIYPVFLVISMCGIISLVLYSHIWKRDVSRKISFVLLALDFLAVALYFAEKIFDTTIALHTIGYVVFELIIIVLIRKIGMYDMSNSIANSIEEYSNYGYILFDKNFKYMGSNSTAKNFLSEINNLHIDEKINEADTPIIYGKLKRFINHDETDVSFSVEEDERILKCNVQKLYFRNKKK